MKETVNHPFEFLPFLESEEFGNFYHCFDIIWIGTKLIGACVFCCGMIPYNSLNVGNLSKERIGELQIIASVIFYAIAFVASRDAMIGGSQLGPISFAACRFLVSTVLLYLVKPIVSQVFHVQVDSDDSPSNEVTHGKYFHLLLWGGLCGLANFGASTLAQIGLVSVSAGKAGFITGMYVVFVPLAEYLIPGYGVHVRFIS